MSSILGLTKKPPLIDQEGSSKKGLSEIGGRIEMTVKMNRDASHAVLYPMEAVNSVKRVTEKLLPYFKFVNAGISAVQTPIDLYNLYSDAKDTVKAPRKLKIVPGLKCLGRIGDLLDRVIAGISLTQSLNKLANVAIPPMYQTCAAVAPMAVTAAVLQLPLMLIYGWHLKEMHKQWKSVEQALQSGPGKPQMEQFKAAVDILAKPASTIKEKFQQRFFTIFGTKQTEKVNTLCKRLIKDNNVGLLRKTFDRMQKVVKHKKFEKPIAIALILLSMVGVAVVSFVAPPVAIIGWTLLALSSVGTIGLTIHGYTINQWLALSWAPQNKPSLLGRVKRHILHAMYG